MATYAFGKAKTFDLAALKALSPVRQQQVFLGTQMFLGEDCESIEACVAAIAKLEDVDVTDDFSLSMYEITKDGHTTPLYEMWTFGGGDDGTVFLAGTAEQTYVHCCQGSFQSYVDDDAEADALAAELDETDTPF